MAPRNDPELERLRADAQAQLQELADAVDWDEVSEVTAPNIHVHLPQPSQPDSAPPKKSGAKLAAAIVGLVGALGALAEALRQLLK